MPKPNKLIKDFYELTVNQIMDKRVWDLPIIEEKDDIYLPFFSGYDSAIAAVATGTKIAVEKP